MSDLFPMSLGGGFPSRTCNKAVIESANLGPSFVNGVY